MIADVRSSRNSETLGNIDMYSELLDKCIAHMNSIIEAKPSLIELKKKAWHKNPWIGYTLSAISILAMILIAIFK
jgi:hypothetical protein